MSKDYCVYVHTNKKNGMMYVGCTGRSPEVRWQNGTGYSSCKKFEEAIKEFGWDEFSHEVVFNHMDKETALLMEEILIKEFNTVKNGYNAFYSGVKGHSQQTKLTKEKIGNAHKGMLHTEETKRKMSIADKGRTPWNKGKKMSLEARQKMSGTHKGKNIGASNPAARKIINTVTGEVYLTVKDCLLKNGISGGDVLRAGMKNPNSKYFVYKYLN